MEDEMDQYDASGKSVHLLLNKLEDSRIEGEKKRVPVGVVRIVTAKNKVGRIRFLVQNTSLTMSHCAARTLGDSQTISIIRIRQGLGYERA